jgi:hypothetical protein
MSIVPNPKTPLCKPLFDDFVEDPYVEALFGTYLNDL